MVNDCILIYKDVFDFEYIFKDISEIVKVQDLLYKNELDVIYYKVVRVSLGGKIIEYLTTKREIYY